MSPKTIFKILISTIFISIFGCVVLELFNVRITASSVNRLTELSLTQACKMFSQESYRNSSGYRLSLRNLQFNPDMDSPTAISSTIGGNFYINSNEKDIFDRLYKNSADFSNFVSNYSGKWKTLDILSKALFGTAMNAGTTPPAVIADIGNSYVNKYMTPLNLGILYLDRATVEHIAKWNISSLLSNGAPDNLRVDGNGAYVNYSGYRVYSDTFKLLSIDYEVLDLTQQAGITRLKELTYLDANSLISPPVNSSALSYGNDSSIICVAKLEYSMDIAYSGITPIRVAMQYLWERQTTSGTGNPVPVPSNLGVDKLTTTNQLVYVLVR